MNGGTGRWTNVPNAQFQFTFEGTYVWYYTDMQDDHGPFSVVIDDVAYATMTSRWIDEKKEVMIFHTALPVGRHQITVTNLENNNTVLDYLA